MARTPGIAATALFGWALWTAQGVVAQEPTDGVCDDSVRNGCAAGTPNDAAVPDNATTYLWRCDGLHGGTNSDKCHIRIEDVPVDGVCDDSVRNGCAAGTANDEAFPDESYGYLWRCDGQHGGRNSDKCFIRIEDVPVDGVCDDSVRNGCAAGTANDAAIPDNSTGYLWRCDGQHGGRNSDKCHIRIEDVPVDGVCDDSARNGCSAGTANDAAVADTTSHYRWRCDGANGGSNSGTCSRAKPPVVSCGVCECTSDGTDARNAGTCSGSGDSCTVQADNCPVDCGVCACTSGRTDATNAGACRISGGFCLVAADNCPVSGRCDNSARNGCLSGSPNDAAVADSETHYQWRCDGFNGGLNSSTCSRAKPPVDPVSCGGSWVPSRSTVCRGESFEQTRSCNAGCNDGDCATSRQNTGTKPCPPVVNGGWAAWGECSETACGTTGSQTRTCTNPSPKNGGLECLKEDRRTRALTETRGCTGSSPVDGRWSDWGDCSPNTCGAAGTQTRACNAPSPACGGAACSGPSSRTCTGNAPVNGVWQTGSWGAWSQCIGCQQARSRSVTCDAPRCGGTACPAASKPAMTETRPCVGSNPIPGNLCRN